MIGFLIVLHTLVSVLLIGMILMQASQGGGLSGCLLYTSDAADE